MWTLAGLGGNANPAANIHISGGRMSRVTHPATPPTVELLEPREVPLGGQRAMMVRRTLPHKSIRTIGAWCFVDDFGPEDVAGTEVCRSRRIRIPACRR